MGLLKYPIGLITKIYNFTVSRDKPEKQGLGQTCIHDARNQPCNLTAPGEEGDKSIEIVDFNSECPTCQSTKRAARNYRIRLIAGLIFPFGLSALDTTIIASALPWIASDFNQISQLNWIISAFNLTAAVFIPFWGQIADILGRHTAIQMCLVLIVVGSALCAGAPTDTFAVLLLGRAFQGMSVAGITVITKIILADKVSLEENSRNTSTFSMFAGISYGVGPVIGGHLTSLSWRWCFGLNIPVAIIGGMLVFFVLRHQLLGPQSIHDTSTSLTSVTNTEHGRERTTLKSKLSTIDFGGQFFLLAGFTLLILALTWGGATYPWVSAQVLVPLIIGGILVVAFVAWEYQMAPGRYIAKKLPFQKPTIPWNLMAQRNMGLLFYIDLTTGMAMIAVLYFSDIYFTLVQGLSASKSGTQLLYYLPGLGAGVYSAMYMCNKWPRQTFLPLFLGSVIEATSLTVLTWALHQEDSPTIYAMMALAGCGTGLRFMPGSLHGVGFFPNHIASVISLVSFAIPFGGTMAMTIMGSVFNNKTGFTQSSSIESAHAGGPAELEIIKKGVVWAYVAILPFMWLCVIAAAALGNVNITQKKAVDQGGQVDFSENIDEGPYLISLLRRRRRDTAATEEFELRRDI